MARAEARDGDLTVRPLTAARVEAVKTVTRGTWGSQCWDLFPRFSAKERRELGISGDGGGPGAAEGRRREILAKLARRRHSAGLVAYLDGEPVGFLSLGPRTDYSRVVNSRVTPPVDKVDAWVIPCITVRRGYRGKGVAVAMLRAAVDHAGKHGAAAVEGYPRAASTRVHDDFAFIGTQELFRRAGFRKVRGPLKDAPRGSIARVTMRVTCTSKTSRPRRARSAKA
jgi:ribosomal protein S18 acetylase RimI-like enzyme